MNNKSENNTFRNPTLILYFDSDNRENGEKILKKVT